MLKVTDLNGKTMVPIWTVLAIVLPSYIIDLSLET